MDKNNALLSEGADRAKKSIVRKRSPPYFIRHITESLNQAKKSRSGPGGEGHRRFRSPAPDDPRHLVPRGAPAPPPVLKEWRRHHLIISRLDCLSSKAVLPSARGAFSE